jgi:hypothetical protein
MELRGDTHQRDIGQRRCSKSQMSSARDGSTFKTTATYPQDRKDCRVVRRYSYVSLVVNPGVGRHPPQTPPQEIRLPEIQSAEASDSRGIAVLCTAEWGCHHPEPIAPAAVARSEPEAASAADVELGIVERAATSHRRSVPSRVLSFSYGQYPLSHFVRHHSQTLPLRSSTP